MSQDITIITTVYNGAPYLERTIQSVVRAGVSQYIIIDGGSRDGTTDLIRRHSDHISYWVSERDRGIYDAMNKGWAVASPQNRVLFLGAGDELLALPQELEQCGPEDVIFGRVYMGERLFNAKVDLRLRLVNTLHHQALLVPRSLSPEPPFDPTYRIYGDFDFNQRLLRRRARFVFSESFLARALPEGVSAKFYVRESLSVVKRNFGTLWAVAAGFYYLFQGARRGFHHLSLRQP